MTLEFLLTALVIIAAPGTGAIYTVAAGLSGGVRASVVAALGCTLGIVPHMLAAISGLAALLRTSAAAFQVLRLFGVAYLLYMAWAMFRQRGALGLGAVLGDKNRGQVIRSAILVNLLNPKLSIFFFAFLPQFVRGDASAAPHQMLELSLVFMLLSFAVLAAYGVLAATLRQRFFSSVSVQIAMRRGLAAAFMALAAQLALTQQ